MVEPRPTKQAPKADIEEALAGVRRALAARDEAPGGAWVEEASLELVLGTKTGFYVPPADGGGIAFSTRRGKMAFGHVHADAGPGVRERAHALADRLLGSLPPDVVSADLGFSGIPPEDEAAVVGTLAARPGSTVIERQLMERPLGPADGSFAAEPPPGVDRLGVRDVTLDALADLDLRGFEGSQDALLVGDRPEDYRRALSAILEDQLGRFLDEASCALVERRPVRLVGALLTAEKSPRKGVFLDVVVDPERRGRGWGRHLLGWGLRALWALGYERVGLWVSLANTPALKLYGELGFTPVSRATIYRWDRTESSAQPHRAR